MLNPVEFQMVLFLFVAVVQELLHCLTDLQLVFRGEPNEPVVHIHIGIDHFQH